MLIFGLILVFITTLCLYRFVDGDPTYSAQSYNLIFHLPANVKPEKYELVLFTNLDGNAPQFHGHVKITVQCVSKTKKIILNKKRLYVREEDVSILPLTDVGEYAAVEQVRSMDNYDRLMITLAQDLIKKNRYLLKIKFSSITSTSEVNDSGYVVDTSKQIAFTNLNVIDARLLFPCFDKMDMKANYKVFLAHAKGIEALTNGRFIKSHEILDEPDWILDEFADTVRMATFSVGIALLNLPHKEFKDPASPIFIRVWADERILNEYGNINKIAFKIFKFFSKLFVFARYPFIKFDIIIFSDDSNINTIDSFGLVFMREVYVSSATKESDSASKFQALSEICIMISRQWVGHSVTMFLPNENWFLDGLNLFLQTMCIIEVCPEMEHTYLQSNIIDSFLQLLRSEENGMWVFVSSENPTLSIGSNDYRSKQKAFHLIRMINFILGPTLFRKFLGTYLTYYRRDNTTLEQVWHVFEVITKNITPNIFPDYATPKMIIESWTNHKGHPLVIITRDYDTRKIKIEQRPLVLYKDEENVKEIPVYNSSWIIPLTYTTQKESQYDETPVREWLLWNGPEFLKQIDVAADEWIIFNPNLEVMVRVHYDLNNWDMIQSTLLDQSLYLTINISTRVRLISDMFVLAEAGELLYSKLFHGMKYLSHEKFVLPWKIALDEFNLMRTRLAGTDDVLQSYQNYVGEILGLAFQEFLLIDKFWDNLHYQRRKLRISITEASCLYEVDACVKKSQSIIQDWNRGDSNPKWPETIPHAVNTIIHCQKVKTSKKYWRSLWKQFSKKSTSEAVQKCILEALGCSQKTSILEKYLERSIKSKKVSQDESFIIFQSLVKNVKGYDVMKEFFMSNYERIRKFHIADNAATVRYLKTILTITTKEKDLDSLIHFAHGKDLNTRSIKESIIKSRSHINWFKRHKFGLRRIFKVPV